MEKKYIKTNWHGIDRDKAISLFEYGLLMRWVPRVKEWQVIYKNPREEETFCFSWVNESELTEIFEDGWAANKKKEFLEFHGINWDEFVQSSVIQKTADIYNYFGAENIFGANREADSVKQICKRLKI